jgi:hypothetical protein
MKDYPRFKKEWTTHMPMLIKAVQASRGAVVELGAGPFSTPLLHWLCLGRRLFTYENKEYYFDFAKRFQSKTHSIRLIDDWDKLKLDRHYGVIFIDHDGHRGEDAVRFKDKADYIVLHDSNEDRYGYKLLEGNFKYRLDWKGAWPWTTVVSNFKNLGKFA